MTTVPNWIAKAVILEPRWNRFHPITEWRATKTQVIVRTAPTGPERRFRLDSLTAVGETRSRVISAHLAPPDDPKVTAVRRMYAADHARYAVTVVVEGMRLQDSEQDIEAVARKLQAIRDAATQALADLEPLL